LQPYAGPFVHTDDHRHATALADEHKHQFALQNIHPDRDAIENTHSDAVTAGSDAYSYFQPHQHRIANAHLVADAYDLACSHVHLDADGNHDRFAAADADAYDHTCIFEHAARYCHLHPNYNFDVHDNCHANADGNFHDHADPYDHRHAHSHRQRYAEPDP